MNKFNKIAIIGIGLIGSSIALKAREINIAGEIALYDIDPEVREIARELKLGRVYENFAELLRGADLVILCVPCGAMEAVSQQIAPFLKAGTILTDVGSVKGEIVKILTANAPENVFVIPGHPIAGTEQSGPRAGFAELFDGRWCIITPINQSEEYLAALAKLSDFWTSLGSKIELMDPARHDLVLAMTSHIPHLIAFCIVNTAEDTETLSESEVVKYSAGGFRDFTRIAASDPTMWRDVFLLNKDAVLDILGRFSEDLTALRRAIRWDDGDVLFDVITRARRMRKEVIDAGQDSEKPNFGR
ncbi:MAG: cyclohexadieny/prephenate dehydrogenase [Hyphomonadaceae bacterium]|nr:MAG: cyclohexadieny/prephenate dehydrogenase [Hyphomonadaceae bacterium]KAF0187037.1 MAG: cyclohexadieny/prephenate dehydrogenase [Hyphomonadaceae bacterium]